MSGCNCKGGNKMDDLLSDDNSPKEKTGQKITTYVFKSLVFIIMLVALPIINLFIIWFIFRTLILNKDVNIKPLLLAIGQKFQDKKVDDEDLDYENLTEEDVELMDVEDITMSK